MATGEEDEERSTERIVLLALGGFAALVVGIVVLIVLAAVVSSFVLGTGESGGSASPQAAFVVTDGDPPVVRHDGGDSIEGRLLVLVVDGDRRGTWATLTGSEGLVTAGDELPLENVSPGVEIELRWTGNEAYTTMFAGEV